jgi:hypothetical protein
MRDPRNIDDSRRIVDDIHQPPVTNPSLCQRFVGFIKVSNPPNSFPA